MVNRYINDDGSNTSPYDTLAKAATTLATALSGASAGTDFLMGMDHAEQPGADLTLNFPGVIGNPDRLISINTTTEDYDRADNVQIDCGTGAFDITINGSVLCYGCSLKAGDNLVVRSSNDTVIFEDCEIELNSSGAKFLLGNDGSTVILINTNVNFSVGGSSSGFQAAGTTNFFWMGGILTHAGVAPSILFDGNASSRDQRWYLSGVDLTPVTGSLIDTVNAPTGQAELRHCLLGAGMSLGNNPPKGTNSSFLMSGCDDVVGDNLYRLDYLTYYGELFDDDAVYRTAGSSDGVTNISWKMVSNANAANFSEPFISLPIKSEYIETPGTYKFTIYIAADRSQPFQDDQVWLKLEYLGGQGSPTIVQSSFADNRMLDIFGSSASPSGPQDQPSSNEAWTGIDAGSPEFIRQRLDITATVDRPGPVFGRVYLAEPSTTLYVDTLLEVVSV